MNKNSISCELFDRHLSDLLDGLLEEDLRGQMEQHACDCGRCGEKLRQMTNMLTMCAELDADVTVPLEAQAAWRSAVRAEAEAGRRKKPTPRVHWRAWGAIAAALALALAVGSLMSLRPTGRLEREFRSEYAMPAAESAYGDAGAFYGKKAMMLSDGAVDDCDLEEVSEEQASANAVVEESAAARQIILRTASRTLESVNFDQLAESTAGLISDFDGRIESSVTSGRSYADGGRGRESSIVARIPSASLDDFLASIDALGTVTVRSETSEDVTERYVDTESRLTAQRTQLDRLLELTRSAADLEELIALEEKIAEVEADIESREQMLRYWRNRESESVVTIELNEVAAYDRTTTEEVTLGQRIQAAFAQALESMRTFLQDALVGLVRAAPALLIGIVALIILWRIVRRIRRRKSGR